MTEGALMSLGLFEGFCPASPQGGADAMGCLLATWETPILVLLGVGLLLLVVSVVRRRGQRARPPRFVLPVSSGGPGRPPPGDRGTPGSRPAPSTPDRDAGGPERAASPVARRPAASTPAPDISESAGSVDTLPPVEELEGTLQLLPAKLEIERGPGKGDHVRFVRLPGETQEITLGRAEGDTHRHIRLESPTVSREHARLIRRGGAWSLQNVSSTNPTMHNGQALDSTLEEIPLSDGDRIEMGEMGFVFRMPKAGDRLALRSSWYTDRGRRSVNQDAVIVKTLPDGRELAAVCDGLGSHAAGGIASHIALDALVKSMSEGAGLGEAAREANRAVLRAAAGSTDREGMGTTLCAAVRKGSRYEIANVGDSRAYRIDGSGIRQVTRDHSFVAEALRDGRMSLEEATRSPWRNAVTRNLGADDEVEVDVFGGYDGTDPFVLMLCTDGIHGILDDEEILRVVRKTRDVRDLARALGEDALINGGKDNVAVAAVRLGPEPNGAGPGG